MDKIPAFVAVDLETTGLEFDKDEIIEVALVRFDTDAIKAKGLTALDVNDLPEKIRLKVNRQMPAYSQIAKVEEKRDTFDKTPKGSIKRFLYS